MNYKLITAFVSALCFTNAANARITRLIPETRNVNNDKSSTKFRMDGDTLVYDADAFFMPDGSTLGELIYKLPAVSITANGSITVNGKDVEEVLFNGRDFFANDCKWLFGKMAADMVENIRVYERVPKDAKYTNKRNATEKELVLDIRIKPECVEKWQGDIEMNYGPSFRKNMNGNLEGKGLARGFMMNEGKTSRFTSYAGIGNYGDVTGRWNNEYAQNVSQEDKKQEHVYAGFNYAKDLNKHADYQNNLKVSFNALKNEDIATTTSTYDYNNTRKTAQFFDDEFEIESKHKYRFTREYQNCFAKNVYFSFEPTLCYNSDNNRNHTNIINIINQLQNVNYNNNHSTKQKSFITNNDLVFGFTPSINENLSFYLHTNYTFMAENEDDKHTRNFSTLYHTEGDTTIIAYDITGHSLTMVPEVFWNLKKGHSLSAKMSYTYNHADYENTSTDIENNYLPTLQYHYNFTDEAASVTKYFYALAAMHFYEKKEEYVPNSNATASFKNFDLNYRAFNAKMHYYCTNERKGRSLEINMAMKDNGNIFYYFEPKLTKTIEYSTSISYRHTFGKTLFNIGGHGAMLHNDLKAQLPAPATDGLSYTSPYEFTITNDDNWNANGYAKIDIPLDSEEKWRLTETVSYTYNKTSLHYGDKYRTVVNQLKLAWRPTNGMEYGVIGMLQKIKNDNSNFTYAENLDEKTINYGGYCQISLPGNIQLCSDITLFNLQSEQEQKRSKRWIWNASISKTLLNNNLTVAFKGYDIFGKMPTHFTSINYLGRTDLYYNRVHSYGQFSLIYHIR